ncbi:MAG: hypothetical protein EBS96_11530, partial [Spartobacteria bacterium]|nr:hypothetical protein [Spartobacteria bacterium]
AENLKLLCVPRGSVRGKCGRRKGADGAPPSEMARRRVGKIMNSKIIFLGEGEVLLGKRRQSNISTHFQNGSPSRNFIIDA